MIPTTSSFKYFTKLPKPIQEIIINYSINPDHFKQKQLCDLRLVSKTFKKIFDRTFFPHINNNEELKEIVETLEKQTSTILIFALDTSNLNITNENIHLFQSLIHLSSYLKCLKFHIFSPSKSFSHASKLDLSSLKHLETISFQKTTNNKSNPNLGYIAFNDSITPKYHALPKSSELILPNSLNTFKCCEFIAFPINFHNLQYLLHIEINHLNIPNSELYLENNSKLQTLKIDKLNCWRIRINCCDSLKLLIIENKVLFDHRDQKNLITNTELLSSYTIHYRDLSPNKIFYPSHIMSLF